MANETLSEKIFGKQYEGIQSALYSTGVFMDKISKTIKKCLGIPTVPLEKKHVVYVDKQVFKDNLSKKYFVERLSKELNEEVDCFDLYDYIYIGSLNGKTRTDMKNSLFPTNLFNSCNKSKVSKIILLFDADLIGTDEFDKLINESCPNVESIIICEELSEYDLLKKTYIKAMFSDIKSISRL